MDSTTLKRREMLKVGLTAVGSVAIPRASRIPTVQRFRTVRLSDCLDMKPDSMARASHLVMSSWEYLQRVTTTIENPKLRKTVARAMANPAPTFTSELADEKIRKAVYGKLAATGLLDAEAIPLAHFLPLHGDPKRTADLFTAAPGSTYESHHAYPGGLVSHTAANTRLALALFEAYSENYGFSLDKDIVIASQIFHDLLKTWVLPWSDAGDCRQELRIAGTPEHHTCSLAEGIARGLPPEVCVAQACAHNHPGWPEAERDPIAWVKAACIMLGKDPVNLHLLSHDGKTLPLPRRVENFVCHMADRDFVITVPAIRWVLPVLKKIAATDYGMGEENLRSAKFNQFRNYLFSQASIMGLYQVLVEGGEDALRETALSIISPN